MFQQDFIQIENRLSYVQFIYHNVNLSEVVSTYAHVAKLSPQPQIQLQLGAEMVIISISVATHPTTTPPTHPDKFRFGSNNDSTQT